MSLESDVYVSFIFPILQRHHHPLSYLLHMTATLFIFKILNSAWKISGSTLIDWPKPNIMETTSNVSNDIASRIKEGVLFVRRYA